MDLPASAAEVCVVETDILIQLAQGNAGYMDLFFGLIAGCVNLRPEVLICRAEAAEQ